MGATILPQRSAVQRKEALEHANTIRIHRARLKREVKAGRASALDVLRDPPEFMASMKVYDLLVAIPRVGRCKALKLLNTVGISPVKTLGGMTERQRTELLTIAGRRR